MPLQPTRQNYHVDVPLTNMSVAWMNEADAFVHDKIFPRLSVPKQSGKYFVYIKGHWFRTSATKRAPATQSAGVGYGIDSSPTYFCDVWAVHHDIGWQEYSNYDEPLDAEADATALVSQHLLLRREKQFFQTYFQPGIWQGYSYQGAVADFQPNVNGKGYWDSATSNPMQDIDLLKKAMLSITGRLPNKLTMTLNVFYAVRNNPQVLDRIKYTQRGIVTEDILASLFGVDEVLVSKAVINSAQEGQTDALGLMSSNSFLLSFAPDSPGLKVPSAGYIFQWTGYLGAGAFGNTIAKIPDPLRKADRIEGEMAFAMNRVSSDCGVFGTNVLANP